MRHLRCLLLLGVLVTLSAGCAGAGASAAVPPRPGGDAEVTQPNSSSPVADSPDPSLLQGPATSPSLEEAAAEAAASSSPDSGFADADDVSAEYTSAPSKVDLVYFHPATACDCLAEVGGVIEDTLRTYFAEEMDQKRLAFHSVVSDDPANVSVVRMYGSQPFDLFVVTYDGGQAKATPDYDLWSYLDDFDGMAHYVRQLVEQHLD